MKKKIYLYTIDVESPPNWVVKNAFSKTFELVGHLDWVNKSKEIGLTETHKMFIQEIKDKKPEYCFLQIQNKSNMPLSVFREASKYSKLIHWTGDVRGDDEWLNWFIEVGEHCFLTLFTNDFHPKILRDKGLNSDYLQIGFDNIWYNKHENISITETPPDIVFLCNEYGYFPESDYRVNAVRSLINHFGDRFKLFGFGWDKHGIKSEYVRNDVEYSYYNLSKIAISISNFNLSRYYSDRLLRILGCGGALALSHRFKDSDKEFNEDKEISIFDNIDELIYKCEYYLNPENETERKKIVDNAYDKAHSFCSWHYRTLELQKLIEKYD